MISRFSLVPLSWKPLYGRCTQFRWNPLILKFTDQGKKRYLSWLSGKMWGLRLYQKGYDHGLILMLHMEILPEDSPWILGPAFKLMLMGDTPVYTSTLHTATSNLHTSISPSSTPKVSFTKFPRDVGELETSPYLMETINYGFKLSPP